ncbi:hypothetical protein Prudu_018827 [Prunus dulcis]|uniref:Uncharacterized protein n=1 Tax=Prunus dulcis TaxID=3755 RepID=A0A4Y1RRM4_PRUDU|nr:hypothetical protein Prudu_018827 [Prunus dulcis]
MVKVKCGLQIIELCNHLSDRHTFKNCLALAVSSQNGADPGAIFPQKAFAVSLKIFKRLFEQVIPPSQFVAEKCRIIVMYRILLRNPQEKNGKKRIRIQNGSPRFHAICIVLPMVKSYVLQI